MQRLTVEQLNDSKCVWAWDISLVLHANLAVEQCRKVFEGLVAPLGLCIYHGHLYSHSDPKLFSNKILDFSALLCLTIADGMLLLVVFHRSGCS